MYICLICCADLPATSPPRLCAVCQELPHFEQQLLLVRNRINGQLDNLVETFETTMLQEPRNGHDHPA